MSFLIDSVSRLAWFRLLGTDKRYSRVRVLMLHVDIMIVILFCSYLGHSGDTVLIWDLQFETKIERK